MTTPHEHYFYAVEFSWGGYWACGCGYSHPTEDEWNDWNENRRVS